MRAGFSGVCCDSVIGLRSSSFTPMKHPRHQRKMKAMLNSSPSRNMDDDRRGPLVGLPPAASCLDNLYRVSPQILDDFRVSGRFSVRALTFHQNGMSQRKGQSPSPADFMDLPHLLPNRQGLFFRSEIWMMTEEAMPIGKHLKSESHAQLDIRVEKNDQGDLVPRVGIRSRTYQSRRGSVCETCRTS